MSSPLGQNNWDNKWGCYIQRQDKNNASPLVGKKKKNDKQPY